MARVRKYLAVKYPRGLVLTPNGDPLTFYIWSMTQTEKVKMRSYGRTPKPLTDTVSLSIHQAHHTRRLTLLNDAEIRMFNKTVDLYLFQEYYQQAITAKAEGITFEQSACEFVERYGLTPDDIQLDCLKVTFHRHRATGEIGFPDANFSSNLSIAYL